MSTFTRNNGDSQYNSSNGELTKDQSASIVEFSDLQLFSALDEDGIYLIGEEFHNARENDGDTLSKIAVLYYKSKMFNKAFAWYYKAALANNNEAQNCVGIMIQNGQGVAPDPKRAVEWYKKAAYNRNVLAQFNLGLHYREGVAIPVDYVQALKWLMEAAKSGNAKAINDIGDFYERGLGVQKNIYIAMDWYRMAIECGEMFGYFSLGELYENQVEVRDLQKAVNYYQKAVNHNVERARESLMRLNINGIYPREEQDDKIVELINKSNKFNVALSNTNHEQSQRSAAEKLNDERLAKLLENNMANLEESFQIKMRLAEKENKDNIDTLKKELYILQKEKIQQDEKNKGNADALKKELYILQQEKIQKDEENKRLKEELASLKAHSGDNNNDIKYNSLADEDNHSDNISESANDINYDTECSDEENNTTTNVRQTNNSRISSVNHGSAHNLSDDEDRANDICYD